MSTKRMAYGARAEKMREALQRPGGVTCIEMATELKKNRGDMSNQFARMQRLGQCVQVRIPSERGIKVRYFATQQMADEWSRVGLPLVEAEMDKARQERSVLALERRRVREKARAAGRYSGTGDKERWAANNQAAMAAVTAAGAAGVRRSDLATIEIARAASRLAMKGKLHAIRDGNHTRLFVLHAWMAAWCASHAHKPATKPPRQSRLKAPKVKLSKYGATKPLPDKPSRPPGVTLKGGNKLQGEVIYPDGVKVTRYPSPSVDVRYQVVPGASVPRVFKLQCESA